MPAAYTSSTGRWSDVNRGAVDAVSSHVHLNPPFVRQLFNPLKGQHLKFSMPQHRGL